MTLEEIIKDLSMEKYSNMSKEILFNLGKTYITDSDCDYHVSQTCSYEGYGLYIYAYDLPGYVYEDKNTGGLHNFIKTDMKKLHISYKGKIVLDTAKNVYIGGIWEDIFNELYNKLYVLKAKKDDSFRKQKHCIDLMKNVIMPLYYERIRKINNSLKVGYYETESSKMNNCGSFGTDYNYTVTKNDEQVFHVVETGVNDFSIHKYVQGSWENELKEFLEEYKIRKEQKDYDDGLKYIRQLKKIK